MAPTPGASGMTQPCRPTALVRFIHRGGRDSQTSVSDGTTYEPGSIFPSGPAPENPLKCYCVENVQ